MKPKQQSARLEHLPLLHEGTQVPVALHDKPGQQPCPPGQPPPGELHAPPSGGVPASAMQQGAGCPQLSMQVGLQPPFGVQHCPW
ncbi:MAG: hypothetical protein M3O46_08735 [Myxococcota bacterium]|nr:hypothetical protein [Myxococcota bacterium]